MDQPISFYLVESNLKHNGTDFKAGDVLEAGDGNFTSLVTDGILRPLAATSFAEAQAEVERIHAAAAEAEAAAEQEAVDTSAQDTWGPTKEEPAAPEAPAEQPEQQPTAPSEPVLAEFKVLKEFEVKNEQSPNFGVHQPGETIKADPVAAKPLVDDGTLELVQPETGDNL